MTTFTVSVVHKKTNTSIFVSQYSGRLFGLNSCLMSFYTPTWHLQIISPFHLFVIWCFISVSQHPPSPPAHCDSVQGHKSALSIPLNYCKQESLPLSSSLKSTVLTGIICNLIDDLHCALCSKSWSVTLCVSAFSVSSLRVSGVFKCLSISQLTVDSVKYLKVVNFLDFNGKWVFFQRGNPFWT